MSFPCWLPGYTFREDVTMSVTYDGGGAANITFSAGDHYDYPQALLTQIDIKAMIAVGGAWDSSIYDATGAHLGMVFISVGAGHVCTLTWGATSEGVRLRDWLGYAGDLAPGAQIHWAPVQHPYAWYPGDPYALQDEELAVTGYQRSARGNSGAPKIVQSSSLTAVQLTCRVVLDVDNPEDYTSLLQFVEALASVRDGETWTWRPNRSTTAGDTTYCLDPEQVGVEAHMLHPPDNIEWGLSVSAIEVA